MATISWICSTFYTHVHVQEHVHIIFTFFLNLNNFFDKTQFTRHARCTRWFEFSSVKCTDLKCTCDRLHQGPKLCFPGHQCHQKFCTGDQNFITGRQWAINYALSRHNNYTNNSFDFQPN